VPYRISTDIGGTFTDPVLADERFLVGRWKSPTTPRDLAGGVFDCLELAARDLGLQIGGLLRATELFVHGSTVATNAVLEGRGDLFQGRRSRGSAAEMVRWCPDGAGAGESDVALFPAERDRRVSDAPLADTSISLAVSDSFGTC